jgi:hypothetical protein
MRTYADAFRDTADHWGKQRDVYLGRLERKEYADDTEAIKLFQEADILRRVVEWCEYYAAQHEGKEG